LRLLMKEDVGKYKFPALRHCVSAGEPLTHEVVSNWKAGTGLEIYEGYGQTETVIQIANVRSRHHELRVGSMGKAMPGYDIHIVDDNQQPVKDGEEGEIAIRVDQERPVGLFTEYWGQPEMTRNAFKNGWYLTGDRAICDPEGYFWFTGRADDIIKSSDFRIGPTEVESTLLKHPAVLEAAVVGKPDATRCQLVKAFVVLHDGYAHSNELAQDIQKHCRALTASYKLPREIEFVTELPKTTTGKVRRVELRELEKHRAAVAREKQCMQETQSPLSS
jgi:medium-chain acyl-CoA synthetase